jgi:glycerol-1-phosphate dehydrogenase [NAD(P)+]
VEKYIAEIMTSAQTCECGNPHNSIPIEKILVDINALEEVVTYIENKSFEHVVLIGDENTFKVAGGKLSHYLTEEKIRFSLSVIDSDENNDVVADEKSVVQALLDIPKETDVLVAIGSGTIHDITRFCSAKMGIPFISVPTAPSVDGFTSMGAPLIIRGVKRTFQMTSPIAVFADLTLLKMSPQKMVAAGFGDMVAKFTSLADWKFGHLVAGEPYCSLAAQITREALESCIVNAEEIAKGNEEGIRILIESLIKSGLAMLLFGQSHPASGGEHHLSHYWEMEFLKQNRPTVLHGAKVGIATSLLSVIYKNDFLELLHDNKGLAALEDNDIVRNINENIQEITAIYKEIPDSALLHELLARMGGETVPEQLDIEEELVRRSLKEAYQLRNRSTALKFMNEVKKAAPDYVRERS